MQQKAARIAMVLFALAVLVFSIYARFAYASPLARSWDEVDFALALDRFDLLAMQPHFPGYPFFILGGMIIHTWVSDPIQALTFFNIGMTLSSIIPIVLLVRRYTGTWKGLLFAALLFTSPGLWMMSAQPMSEAAAIAIVWWLLWSIREALRESASTFWSILPLFIFGLLMGIRVSFFPFGIGIVLLWFKQYHQSQKAKRLRWRSIGRQLMIAICFQFIWVGGLVWSEGSPAGFLQLSIAFIKGHFAEWGGGITSSPVPFGQRIVQFFVDNLLWSSVLGHSMAIGILLLLWLIVIGMGSRSIQSIKFKRLFAESIKIPNGQFMIGLLACIVLYTLWALFGQNIEKPRHITPIVGPLMFLVFLLADKAAARKMSPSIKLRPALIYICLIVIITTQLFYGTTLLKRQAVELPAVYQLDHFLTQQEEKFTLYTWEETRVLQYLKANYEHKQIFTYAYFRAELAARSDQRVLLTDHVLRGFELQTGQSLHDHVKQIGRFKSDPLFEPVYDDIVLYEWISNS